MQPFTYTRANSAESAVRALVAGGPGTRLLAGGTTLYDLMKLNVERPAHVVDLSFVKELRAIDTAGNQLVLGAMARMSDVAEDPRVIRDYPALSESLWKAASQQVRNMASIGGNLLQRTRCAYFRFGEPFPCNKRVPGSGCAAQKGLNRGHAILGGSPACIATYPGDWAVALTAFEASIDVLGPKGERSIAIADLYREPGSTPHIETVLAADELILRIRVPASQLGRASTYHKIRDRESYAFALASAAVAVVMEGEIVRDLRIALGGVATRPWRAREAEQTLIGRSLEEDSALAAGTAALREAQTTEHNAFRRELGARTIADALLIAKRRAA
jgi:xanthine dehydrogenase YagS FAD-binding subunit